MSNDLNTNGNGTNNNPENCKCQAPMQMQPRTTRVPAVDIYQNGEDVVLELDMPGVSKENVDIQLENNILTLCGKINEVPSQWSLIHCESTPRDYKRSFELGSEVDTDHIQANMNAGVLKITLPKIQSAKPRKITVTA